MYKLNRIYLSLIACFLLLSCGDGNKATVIVHSCVNSQGEEIQEAINVTVDGTSKTWLPGDPLKFRIDMGVDQGFVNVSTSSENYRLVSPTEYEIQRSEGLELVLSFESTLEPTTRPAPPVADQNTPQTVTVNVNVTPESTQLVLVSQQGDNRTPLQGSGNVELPPGSYRWSASRTGYMSDSGTFTAIEGSSNQLSITLEQQVQEQETEVATGSLVTIVTPASASVNLQHRSSGEQYNFDASVSGARDIPAGSYRYSIQASGYQSQSGQLVIQEGQETELYQILLSQDASQLIAQAENVSNVEQAIKLVDALNSRNSLPSVDLQSRSELFGALVDVGLTLYNGNEQTRAMDLFERLYSAAPSNYRILMEYGSILSRRGDFERSREMFRSVFGQMQNQIPRTSRESVVFQARYRYAMSFYREYTNLPSDAIDTRHTLGRRAYSEFMDVITRYESSGSLSQHENLYNQARDFKDILLRDLGL